MDRLDLNDPVAVLLAVDRALSDAGVETALYGGLALAAYGTARETRDADVAVAGPGGELGLRALQAAGIPATLVFDRVVFGGNFVSRLTLFEEPRPRGATSINTADLVEPRSARYARLALDRALEGELREAEIQVLSPEDFILFKLLSTRDRDLEDAVSVVQGLGALEFDYVKDQALILTHEIPDHDIQARLRRFELLLGLH